MDTDEDLLVYMAMRIEDLDGAREAWGKYYERHIEFIYGVLKGRLARDLTDDSIKDLAQETMRRAYSRAETYSPALGDMNGAKRPETASRPWLMAIARNLVQDALAQTEFSNSEERLAAEPCADTAPSVSDEQFAEVSREMRELSEREQEVITLTLSVYPDRLSPGQARALADRLGTTTANMRQIRKRALAKLKIKLRKFDVSVLGGGATQ